VLGDEAVLLKHRLPQALVIRGRDKLGAARVAVELGAEMVVIDDGFQHQRLERDLDIVLLDDGWQRPFSRSYRREGNRALFDADLLWHHQRGPYTPSWDASASGVRVDVCSTIRPVGLFDRVGRRQATASELQGRKVAAMAAIARPQPFFDLLGQLGAEIVFRAGFADHRAFPESAIIEAKRQRPEVLICTEKDLVRGAADHGFVALRTEIGLTKGKQLVTSRLDELVCGC
jgi:tetraacyldisaccharide 4'-kinase